MIDAAVAPDAREQGAALTLFCASTALYPARWMPAWLQAISKITPLSYEVDRLRGVLLGRASNVALDFGALIVALLIGITAASALLPRLAR
jgi:ABC-2 type transport system permease protein